MAGKSPLSKDQWETIKLAYVGGTPAADLVRIFPPLTIFALRKAALRGKWPVPSRIAAALVSGETENMSPSLSYPLKKETNPAQIASEITMESAKRGGMASLAGWVHTVARDVAQRKPFKPNDISEELAQIRTLAKLSGVGTTSTQVNVGVAVHVDSPWARKTEEPRWIEPDGDI